MSEYKNMDTHIKESERIGNEVADAYNKGIIENLKKADTEIVKAFNERYKAINYQHEYGLITTEEYYKKLEQARNSFFSADTQEWHKYTEEIFNYRKSALSDYQEYVEKNIEDLLKTLDKARDGYKEKLLDFSGSKTGFKTHKTIVENYWPNGDPLVMVDYSLSDYGEEIEKLRKFNDSVTKLKERAKDVDPEVFSMFFDEIKGMSVDDAKILVDLLLKADTEDFKKQFDLYGVRNTLAQNIATSFYADEYEEAAATITEELKETFGEVSPEFFSHGQDVAKNFADGFTSEINSLLSGFSIEIPIIPSAESSNVENNTFSPVYYFYEDRAATSRTRLMAKNDALYTYMRGLSNK